jgi:hypothetical protein
MLASKRPGVRFAVRSPRPSLGKRQARERFDEVARESVGGSDATVPVRLDATQGYLVGDDEAHDAGGVAAGEPVGVDPGPTKGTASSVSAPPSCSRSRRRRLSARLLHVRQIQRCCGNASSGFASPHLGHRLRVSEVSVTSSRTSSARRSRSSSTGPPTSRSSSRSTASATRVSMRPFISASRSATFRSTSSTRSRAGT